jgi:uncharacterized protein YkuJ
MKITKSELKTMIRETLREELAPIKESVETLDVSASEVDDLARDVYIDAEFEDAYKADGYTVGEAVEALIVEVISSEYPNVDDLGSIPERVADALSNMLEAGLLESALPYQRRKMKMYCVDVSPDASEFELRFEVDGKLVDKQTTYSFDDILIISAEFFSRNCEKVGFDGRCDRLEVKIDYTYYEGA